MNGHVVGGADVAARRAGGTERDGDSGDAEGADLLRDEAEVVRSAGRAGDDAAMVMLAILAMTAVPAPMEVSLASPKSPGVEFFAPAARLLAVQLPVTLTAPICCVADSFRGEARSVA